MPTKGTSPADGLHLVDNFAGLKDDVTTGLFSELNWELAAIGNAGTNPFLTSVAYGGFRHLTAGTADGDGDYYRALTDGLVLNGKGGFVRTRVRYPEITGNVLTGSNFRIGVDDSVTATSPTVGIWIDSDAGVLSLQADSAAHGDLSASAAGVSTLTSGTTMVLGTWHDLEIRWSGTNAQGGPKDVFMYVDGELAAQSLCNIDDDEPVELKMVFWQDSGGAATLEIDVDYYEFFQAR